MSYNTTRSEPAAASVSFRTSAVFDDESESANATRPRTVPTLVFDDRLADKRRRGSSVSIGVDGGGENARARRCLLVIVTAPRKRAGYNVKTARQLSQRIRGNDSGRCKAFGEYADGCNAINTLRHLPETRVGGRRASGTSPIPLHDHPAVSCTARLRGRGRRAAAGGCIEYRRADHGPDRAAAAVRAAPAGHRRAGAGRPQQGGPAAGGGGLRPPPPEPPLGRGPARGRRPRPAAAA